MNDSPTPTTAASDAGPQPGPIARARARWRRRHQHPFNFWIHCVGVPVAIGGAMAIPLDLYWGAAGLGVGYFLQYVGHRVEGNDVGEWAAIKHLLGLPCVAISPRWQQPAPDVQMTRVGLETSAGADGRQNQGDVNRADRDPNQVSRQVKPG